MKVTGDLQRARGYSKWALGLNVAALIIIVLIVLCLIIILEKNRFEHNNRNGYPYGSG